MPNRRSEGNMPLPTTIYFRMTLRLQKQLVLFWSGVSFVSLPAVRRY